MKYALSLLFLALFAGCADVSTHRLPHTDLSRLQRIFVEKRLADDYRINELIVGELQRRGATATTGPLTMKPDDAQAVVTYVDRWAWDFTTYLIEIWVEVRDARTNKLLAAAHYHRAPLSRQSSSEIIAELFDRLFGRPGQTAGP